MWGFRGTERAGASDGVPPWTRLEHRARYDFAATWVRGGVVVDCACGDGSGARAYLRGRPDLLLGLDLDVESIERARGTVADPAARFEVADATALPCADQSVDLYISLETIEHVPDAEAMLAECVRVLRPEGRFICSTPNRHVTNPGTTAGDQPICRFHRREYAPDEFLGLLRPYFGVIARYGQNEVGDGRRFVLAGLRRISRHRLAARLSQAVKLTRLARDDPERHAVVPVTAGHMYDFMVAVCSQPQPSRRQTECPR